MDRYWLLTSTFYGNWLPGDRPGFVSSVRDRRPDETPSLVRLEHDLPGTPYDEDLPRLYQSAREQLRGPPLLVHLQQAQVLIEQFQETATFRKWELRAAAVMANHIHLVVGVSGDPDPEKLLGDFKVYGSRTLNARWPRPASGTWWTRKGSKRKLPDAMALSAAIAYVRNQPNSLAVWS